MSYYLLNKQQIDADFENGTLDIYKLLENLVIIQSSTFPKVFHEHHYNNCYFTMVDNEKEIDGVMSDDVTYYSDISNYCPFEGCNTFRIAKSDFFCIKRAISENSNDKLPIYDADGMRIKSKTRSLIIWSKYDKIVGRHLYVRNEVGIMINKLIKQPWIPC